MLYDRYRIRKDKKINLQVNYVSIKPVMSYFFINFFYLRKCRNRKRLHFLFQHVQLYNLPFQTHQMVCASGVEFQESIQENKKQLLNEPCEKI